ncbi:MAG: hypothetical protein EBZ47_10465, partial [Chlamydiae bacterium]|nr:hypothetical protein [Chlamydiota bacterium]
DFLYISKLNGDYINRLNLGNTGEFSNPSLEVYHDKVYVCDSIYSEIYTPTFWITDLNGKLLNTFPLTKSSTQSATKSNFQMLKNKIYTVGQSEKALLWISEEASSALSEVNFKANRSFIQKSFLP